MTIKILCEESLHTGGTKWYRLWKIWIDDAANLPTPQFVCIHQWGAKGKKNAAGSPRVNVHHDFWAMQSDFDYKKAEKVKFNNDGSYKNWGRRYDKGGDYSEISNILIAEMGMNPLPLSVVQEFQRVAGRRSDTTTKPVVVVATPDLETPEFGTW